MKTSYSTALISRLGLLLLLMVAAACLGLSQTTGTGPVGPPVPAPLSVVIIAPTNGEVFTAPADILISANTRDLVAYVNRITFYANSTELASFTLDPPGPSPTATGIINVQYNWTNVSAGAYALTVVASDTAGNTATSAPINIQVSTVEPPLPVVTIYATDPIAVEGGNFPPYTPTGVAANYITPNSTNTATLVVHRTGSTVSDLTVFYSIGGTAQNGVDYVTLPGQVTIPAGKSFALITIIPIERVVPITVPPLYRTVILTLIQPPTTSPVITYIIGKPDRAEAIILERLPVMPPIGLLADVSFNLCHPATNGEAYSIQVSTDLANWVPICTVTVVKGAIVFMDPEASVYSARFYRAVPAIAPATY